MKKIFTTILLGFSPVVSFAAGRNIASIANNIKKFLSSLVVPMLFTIALSWFIWGVVDFIKSAENSEEREKGKTRMLWGIIALFAMIAFLGLTSILTNTFFNTGTILPQFYTGD
jgi:nitrogen fixation/metabolism regulation signal transduction histidine kinase